MRQAPDGGVYLTAKERYSVKWNDEFAAAHIHPAGPGAFHLDAGGCAELAEATDRFADAIAGVADAFVDITNQIVAAWQPVLSPANRSSTRTTHHQ